MSTAPLNKDLPVALYHQIRCALAEAIDNGQWQSGQQLPNESQLALRFGVSKITVRQALQKLADLGYVRREQGRGTFVSKPKLDQGPRDLTSFSEEMRRHRLTAASRVIERAVTPANPRVIEALELRDSQPVFVLKRLRMADGEPMGIQTAHLPLALVPELAGKDLENVSLYEVLLAQYGLEPASARETYRAVAADASAAQLLGIAPASPVFSVERVTRLAGGKPFEFVQSVIRGDRYDIILELTAKQRRS